MSEFETVEATVEAKPKKAKKHLKAGQTFTMSVQLTVDGPDENGNSDLIADITTLSEGGGEYIARHEWRGWMHVAVEMMVNEFEQHGLKSGYSATVKGFGARNKEEKKLEKVFQGIGRLCDQGAKYLGE